MLATDYDKSHLPHLPRIIIEAIPHNDHRYETCGDWFYNEKGELVIRVSQTNIKHEFLIALHEVVEAMLCNFKGIDEQKVTDFDLKFEKMRSEYPDIVGDKEPGDEDAAPYMHEHAMATRMEQWLASSIGVDWNEYEKQINSLTQTQ